MAQADKRPDHYADLCASWRAQFCTWDHAAQMQKLQLPGLFPDRLELVYFHTRYVIDRHTGWITNTKNPGQTPGFSTQMALYHLLYYAKAGAQNSGEWVPFRSVPQASPFDPAFQKTVLRPFADAFSGRLPLLRAVGTQLGFSPLRQSDAGFYVEAFPCVPLQFLFWDGDEEFPAQANILFDRRITEFTHVETVVTMAGDGVAAFLSVAALSTCQKTVFLTS